MAQGISNRVEILSPLDCSHAAHLDTDHKLVLSDDFLICFSFKSLFFLTPMKVIIRNGTDVFCHIGKKKKITIERVCMENEL